MTVTYFRSAQIPSFICSSTDMSGSKVSGISVPGAHVFFTDTQKEYIVNSDLTLVPYIFNTSSYTIFQRNAHYTKVKGFSR